MLALEARVHANSAFDVLEYYKDKRSIHVLQRQKKCLMIDLFGIVAAFASWPSSCRRRLCSAATRAIKVLARLPLSATTAAPTPLDLCRATSSILHSNHNVSSVHAALVVFWTLCWYPLGSFILLICA